MRDIDGLAGGEHRTRDAGRVGQADLHRTQALPDLRPQRLGLLVIEEQRAALGIEHARGLGHDLLEQRVDLDVRGEIAHHLEELELLLADALHPLDQRHALQPESPLRGDGGKQFTVLLGELADLLVQCLGNADQLALGVADRHTQDALRLVAGSHIHGIVEALVLVGVMDDGRLAILVDPAGDTAIVHQPDLLAEIALCHPAVQLIGGRVVEEQRAAIGPELVGAHLHQQPEDLVERIHRRDLLRDRQQQTQQILLPGLADQGHRIGGGVRGLGLALDTRGAGRRGGLGRRGGHLRSCSMLSRIA